MNTVRLSMITKIAIKIFKIVWLLLGIIILLWTGFWYYKSLTIGTLGVIATALLMATGLYALMIYIPITVILIIIYLILKKKTKLFQEKTRYK